MVAIAGGRNLADEYFMRSQRANFVDMDVLVTGAVLGPLSELFDRFWNSEQAYPVQAFAKGEAGAFTRLSAAANGDVSAPALDRFGRAGIVAQLDSGRLALHFARIELLADDPAKATGVSTPTTRDGANVAMAAAQSQLTIVSPYFVPGDAGLAMMRSLTERGVRISVTTNSLGATDEPLVHSGYAKYRLPLLKMGAKLQELGATLSRKAGVLGNFRSSQGRLHAKLLVIDQSRLFIGSMNMDGRSERHNTELGLLIDSPVLAAEVTEMFHAGAQASTYRLRLTAEDRIEWLADEDDATVVHAQEPGQSAALALKLAILSAIVAEDLL